jgi:hypothetical protein
MEYIELGPVPCMETCAQVGTDDFEAVAKRECLVFQRMLARLFPPPDGYNVRYVTRRYPHDLGAYFEVCVGYGLLTPEGRNEAVAEFAFGVERNTPEHWDAVAHYELAWFQRRDAYRCAVRSGSLASSEVPAHLAADVPPVLPAHAEFCDLLATFPL